MIGIRVKGKFSRTRPKSRPIDLSVPPHVELR